MKICEPNGMPCHHHMEDQIIIIAKDNDIFNYIMNEINSSNQ
jgi:hypothetical protein